MKVGQTPAWLTSMVLHVPAWLVSMLLHVVVLLSMALIAPTHPQESIGLRTIDASSTGGLDEFDNLQSVELPTNDDNQQQDQPQDVAMPESVAVEQVEVASEAVEVTASEVSVDVAEVVSEIGASTDLLKPVSKPGKSAVKGAFAARSSSSGQRAMIKAGGGDPEEVFIAVERSCEWFFRHQMPDGGWWFDFKKCPGCLGQCANVSGAYLNDRTSATALALLPMLGQGYTHKATDKEKAKYRRQVEAGLVFLSQAVIAGKGKAYGSPVSPGGNLYTQGLAGIVLSEAYGMTKDPNLLVPAQAALDFIMLAQDPAGGGWGYTPRSPGTADTSVVGWQVMALKSGVMSGLRVDPIVLKRTSAFLDMVQFSDGADYGYRQPKDRPIGSATSGAGLLCRMFTDWKKSNDALIRGAKQFAKQGPTSDLYLTYYATQILYHLKDQLKPEWDSWREKMTAMLKGAQITSGHQEGSYAVSLDKGHGGAYGGTLYVTSMATMTLEVYFKHGLPLYRDVDSDAKEQDDFVE